MNVLPIYFQLARLAALASIIVAAMLPAGAVVACSTDSGHQEIELVHPTHPCGGDSQQSAGHGADEHECIQPGCTDTSLESPDLANIRHDQDLTINDSPTPSFVPCLFMDQQAAPPLSALGGGGYASTAASAFPPALRCVVLRL